MVNDYHQIKSSSPSRLGIILTITTLVIAMGAASLNASFFGNIKSGLLSPINTPVYAPSLDGYGYQVNGTLNVVKNVVGGPLGASNFTMQVYNNNFSSHGVVIASFPGSSAGVATSLLGNYDVHEVSNNASISLNNDYSTTFSPLCYGTMYAGQNRTCVVTNTFKGYGHLTVIKKVVGGPFTASNFTMEVYRVHGYFGNYTENFIRSFPGSASGTTIPLLGPYDMNESAAGPNISLKNYTTTFSTGCFGTLTSGQSATCVITNTFIGNRLGSLTVIKRVIGGPVGPSSFTMQVYNNTLANHGTIMYSFPGSSSGTTEHFLGIYDVHENSTVTSLSNYSTTFSPGCYGTLYAGRNEVCTVTNTYKTPGQLTVIKRVVGGSFGPSNFTMNVYSDSNNGNISSLLNQFPGSSAGVTVPVNGRYSVVESSSNVSLSNYRITYSGDCFSTLSTGQKATCTITNHFRTRSG